jgi:predicted metal-dependent phosphoesterase TrpH
MKEQTGSRASDTRRTSRFRADFHMHTHYSLDSLSKPKDVLAAALKRRLSAIAITDHDEISGAFEAREIAEDEHLPLQVVVGEEVSTDEGDLLTYFLKKRIAPGPLADVLSEVKKQGAICSAAHPYDFIRHGIKVESIPASLLAKIDAIEAFNARITIPSHNARALAFAVSHRKPVLAGSDAHHPSEVGAAFAEFSGVKKLDAKNLLSAPRTLSGSLSPKYVHAYSRYAVLKKRIFGKRTSQK